jgi:hypothetical protein
MNSKNIVNSVGILNNIDVINNIYSDWYRDEQCLQRITLKWKVINMSSARSITPPKFPNVSMNVWIVNECSYFVWGAHIM